MERANEQSYSEGPFSLSLRCVMEVAASNWNKNETIPLANLLPNQAWNWRQRQQLECFWSSEIGTSQLDKSTGNRPKSDRECQAPIYETMFDTTTEWVTDWRAEKAWKVSQFSFSFISINLLLLGLYIYRILIPSGQAHKKNIL